MMRKLGWAGVLAGSMALSGCAADLVFLAVQAAQEGFTIKYTPVVERVVMLEPSLQSVRPMDYKRHFMRAEGKCTFKGLIVPWQQTWAEAPQGAISTGQVATPAMSGVPPEVAPSGKVDGYAAVIYQRLCPNEAPQSLLHMGRQGTGFITENNSVNGTNNLAAHDTLDTLEPNRPEWTQQVLQRVIDLAPANPDAKHVVLTASNELLQVLPQQKAAVDAILAEAPAQ